jgi:trehalose 6-phosphate phosphatase
VDALASIAADPARAAILLDVDGVLAPIVPRPEDARVPPDTQVELRRLASRYALVACISGRASADARDVVGVRELVYVGNHGLELADGASEWTGRLATFLSTVDWRRTENKGVSAALHFRDAPDEAAARSELEQIAQRARAAGFVARFGRKVLEIVPPLHADKGTAVRELLRERGLQRALYVGDDTTDLDAFRALNGLQVGVRVAVASAESPSALRDAADVVVTSTDDVLTLLRKL